MSEAAEGDARPGLLTRGAAAAGGVGDQGHDEGRGPTHLEDYSEYRKKLKSVVHTLCAYGINTRVTHAHCLYMRGWWRLARSYLGKALSDWKALLVGTNDLRGQKSSHEGTPVTVAARARHLVQQLKNTRQKDIVVSGKKKKKKTTRTVFDREALLASTLALRPVPVDFRDCGFLFGERAHDVHKQWEAEQAMLAAKKVERERKNAAAADASEEKIERVAIQPLPAGMPVMTQSKTDVMKGKAKSMW